MVPKELINIEIEFALRAMELEPTTLESALYNYTAFYGMLFVPSSKRDPNHLDWLEYLAYIKGKDIKEATDNYYQENLKKRGASTKIIFNGKPCFVYHIEGDQAFLHFNNNEGAKPSPLSQERIGQRMEELGKLFLDIKENHQEVRTVICNSWLVNIPAFMLLFPKEFNENKEILKNDFGSFNIWGQFLGSNGKVKDDMVINFRNKVRESNSYNELINSFKYYTIKTKAPIDVFYDFYL